MVLAELRRREPLCNLRNVYTICRSPLLNRIGECDDMTINLVEHVGQDCQKIFVRHEERAQANHTFFGIEVGVPGMKQGLRRMIYIKKDGVEGVSRIIRVETGAPRQCKEVRMVIAASPIF